MIEKLLLKVKFRLTKVTAAFMVLNDVHTTFNYNTLIFGTLFRKTI